MKEEFNPKENYLYESYNGNTFCRLWEFKNGYFTAIATTAEYAVDEFGLRDRIKGGINFKNKHIPLTDLVLYSNMAHKSERFFDLLENKNT
jgi:hypothetical protein